MDETVLAKFDENKQGRIYTITLNIPNSESITGKYIDKIGNVVIIDKEDGSKNHIRPIQLSIIKEVSLVSEADNSGPILKGEILLLHDFFLLLFFECFFECFFEYFLFKSSFLDLLL